MKIYKIKIYRVKIYKIYKFRHNNMLLSILGITLVLNYMG